MTTRKTKHPKDDLYYIVKMPDVENWHDCFLEITKRIEQFEGY